LSIITTASGFFSVVVSLSFSSWPCRRSPRTISSFLSTRPGLLICTRPAHPMRAVAFLYFFSSSSFAEARYGACPCLCRPPHQRVYLASIWFILSLEASPAVTRSCLSVRYPRRAYYLYYPYVDSMPAMCSPPQASASMSLPLRSLTSTILILLPGPRGPGISRTRTLLRHPPVHLVYRHFYAIEHVFVGPVLYLPYLLVVQLLVVRHVDVRLVSALMRALLPGVLS